MLRTNTIRGLCLLLACASGCADDSKSKAPADMTDEDDVRERDDAAMPGATPDGSVTDTEDSDEDPDVTPPAMPADAGMEPTKPVSTIPTTSTSNTSGAVITTTPISEDAKSLQLVSSHLSLRPSGSQYFMEWYGVIANRGKVPLCFVQAEVDFLVGTTVALEAYGFASALPHQTSSPSTLSTACIGPDQIGIVYDNGFEAANFNVQTITKIEIKLEGGDNGASIHPSAPVVEKTERAAGFTPTSYRVKGTLRSVADIHNIGLDVYLMDANWLVFDRLSAINLEALPTGQRWDFETDTTDLQSYATIHPFARFITGFPKAAQQKSVSREAEGARRHQERVDAARARFEQ